jgi:hypothetical protein
MSYRYLPVLALTLASACVVRWDDTPDQRFDDDDSFSSVSSGGWGGEGGAGGDQGGAGEGGAGGDPYECNDGVGYGSTVALCDALPMSPDNAGLCDDGYPAMGYDACVRVYDIWDVGHAEQLADCLADVAPADFCAPEPFSNCVGEAYAFACYSDYIADNCSYWNDLCFEEGDALDVSKCTNDLQPFSEAGLYELSDCMNSIEGTCQERYDLCFEGMTTLE